MVAVGDTVYCELRHATKYKVRVVNGFGWLQPLARLSILLTLSFLCRY